MKKAFTLLEVTISITILTIMMVFLYKVLDQTRISNDKLTKTQHKLLIDNRLNKIFIEDILESSQNIKITKNRDENSIVTFTTNNSYHNPFYRYVIYMIGQNKSLFRIESKIEFKKLKETSFDDEDLYFIDELQKDVDTFEVYKKDKEIILLLNKEIFKIINY